MSTKGHRLIIPPSSRILLASLLSLLPYFCQLLGMTLVVRDRVKEGPDDKPPTTHSKQKSPWKSRGKFLWTVDSETGSRPVGNGVQTPAEGLLRYLSAGTTGDFASTIHLPNGDLPNPVLLSSPPGAFGERSMSL